MKSPQAQETELQMQKGREQLGFDVNPWDLMQTLAAHHDAEYLATD